MSARDELAKVIFASNRSNTQIDLQDDRRLKGSQLAWAGYAAAAILAAGYRKPQQVTTEADLEALPARSVILLDDGNAIQKDGHYWFEASSYDMPMTALYIWENDFLPATVLHVGGAS